MAIRPQSLFRALFYNEGVIDPSTSNFIIAQLIQIRIRAEAYNPDIKAHIESAIHLAMCQEVIFMLLGNTGPRFSIPKTLVKMMSEFLI